MGDVSKQKQSDKSKNAPVRNSLPDRFDKKKFKELLERRQYEEMVEHKDSPPELIISSD